MTPKTPALREQLISTVRYLATDFAWDHKEALLDNGLFYRQFNCSVNQIDVAPIIGIKICL